MGTEYLSNMSKFCINKRMLYIVCGISQDMVHIITAYYPDIDKCEKDMKRGNSYELFYV